VEGFPGELFLTEGAGTAAPTSVDDYLAAFPEAPPAALEKLRKQIKAGAPGATETISSALVKRIMKPRVEKNEALPRHPRH
jgi:uncharacterized protein YdhG (YjbR/CyaY superfamily)